MITGELETKNNLKKYLVVILVTYAITMNFTGKRRRGS